MSLADKIQTLIATAPSIVSVLELAEAAGSVFLAEDYEDAGPRVLLGLMPDGSLFLSIVQNDPDDSERELWNTVSFPSLAYFSKFLHGDLEDEAQLILPLLPTDMRQYLTIAVDKFVLARHTEAGHA